MVQISRQHFVHATVFLYHMNANMQLPLWTVRNRSTTSGMEQSYCHAEFVLGLILWFWDNLWFDDLRVEKIRDRLNIISSRGEILFG